MQSPKWPPTERVEECGQADPVSKAELHLLSHPRLYNGALQVDVKGLLRGFSERIQCSKRGISHLMHISADSQQPLPLEFIKLGRGLRSFVKGHVHTTHLGSG